jgi:ABC-type Fe3+ transport system permease subunit
VAEVHLTDQLQDPADQVEEVTRALVGLLGEQEHLVKVILDTLILHSLVGILVAVAGVPAALVYTDNFIQTAVLLLVPQLKVVWEKYRQRGSIRHQVLQAHNTL